MKSIKPNLANIGKKFAAQESKEPEHKGKFGKKKMTLRFGGK